MADKEVRVRITGDMSDLLKKLKALEDAFNELGDKSFDNKGINNAIEKLERAQKETEELGDKANEAADAYNKFDSSKLSNIADRASETNKNIKDLADNAEKTVKAIDDIGDKTKALDTTVWDDINSYMDNMYEKAPKISEAMSDMGQNISDGFNVDLDSMKKDSNKIGDIFAGSLLEAGLEGRMIGNMVSSSIKDVLGDTEKVMKEFSEALVPEEAIKNFDELIKKLIKVQDTYDDTAKKLADKQDEYDNLLFERGTWSAKAEEAKQDLESLVKEYEKAAQALEEYKKKVESTNESINKNNKDFADWANENERVTKELEAQRKVVQDLQKEYDDSSEGVKDYSRVLNDLVDRVHDVGKSFDNMSFDSKILKGLSNELKNMNFDNFKDGAYKLDYINKAFEDTFVKIEDNIRKCNDSLNNIYLGSLSDEIRDLIREYNDLWDTFERGQAAEDFIERMNDVASALQRVASDQGFGLVEKRIRQVIPGFEVLEKLGYAWGDLDEIIADNATALNEYKDSIDQVRESQEKLNKLQEEQGKLDQLGKDVEALDEKKKVLDETTESLRKQKEELGDVDAEQERLTKNMEEAKKAAMETSDEWVELSNAYDKARVNLHLADKEIEQMEADMAALKATLAEGDKITKEQAGAINEQYRAYENLSRRVKAYLENEENGILLREKVAKSFKETSDAMEQVYAGSKKLNNFELVNKTLAEAAEYVNKLDIVDTKNLQADLARLGDLIEDKTDKIKRLKEISKEYGTDANGLAHYLDKESKSLRDNADATKVVVEAVDTLRDAWGDISIGGEDHLKLRARSELLNDYGEKLKENIKDIRNYYHELQTLDEIYEQATDKQRQTIDDYKAWEKNKEALKEYNDAIRDYFDMLKDTGGKIDDKFLDDSGNFDVKKFIDDYDRLGTAMMVLTKQANAMKQQVLESLKYEKESIESKRKLAKETLEQAQANQKAAKAQYDSLLNTARQSKSYEEQQKAIRELVDANEKLKKATEELARAEKDYADINDKSVDDKRVNNAKDLVKQYNEQAEALRKLGAAVNDIELDDIRDFDKSLGSSLKDILDIDKDVPKTFRDFAEDIKAMFTELGDFDFGGAGDILKDLGKGLLDALPADIKAATVMFTGLTTAVNKLYQAGKQQFFEGLTNIGNKLSPIIDMIQNFGDEARDAFENITDTQIDLSSLMELGPNFEYDMQKVGAIAGSNKRQLEELTKTAEVLGGTTQYTASDVAEAFQYMAMAGYDTEAMLSSINGTLSLSIASGTGLAETTDIVTDYMTALGLEANSTNDFVDKLAATVTSSNTTVEKYGMSMRQVASQAGALGISMTDLSTAIGLQANAGVKGAKAGTALKNVLANMAAPTKKQEEALKKLGFTADETGSYFKTTADGAVDLEATVKQLMTSTDKMTKSQKAAVLAQLAGREALPGLMALLSQGAEGWDELSNTIENSTGKVQYWNECMSLAGKSGKEATDAIENMKNVFAEVETEALNAGLSSEELSHAIAILGDDGKVTSDNVRQLVNVIDSMNTATGDAEEKWRALDAASDDFVNTGYDYDATIAKITADTTGLSQATKESIKNKLDENMTYEEANAVLKEYGLTAEKVSFSTLSYADKLEYLRDNLKGCSDEYIKNQLASLGLADSFEEVKEVVSMTDEEFAAYKKNLETVKGMAEQLAEAMDETTKSSLLNLASAIENVAITAFNNLKPVLKGAVDAINEFFDTWHNGDENVFTFDGLEKGLAGLADKIRAQKGNIQQAVADLFSGIDTFVNGGSLDSLLDMGTSIVQSICKGIQQAKDNGSLDAAIDGAIQKICNWITTNGPQIEQAGKTIIDSLKSGIERNSDSISAALDTLCSVINTWASSSAQLESTAALFADKFVDSFVENTTKGFANKGAEIIQAITSVLNPGMSQHYPEGQGKTEPSEQEEFFAYNAKGGFLVDWIKGGIQKAKEWLFGESYAAELGEEVGTQVTEGYNNKLIEGKETTNATANEIGTGISEGIGNALLSMDVSQLQLLQTEMTNLQTTTATVATGIATSFTNIQNSARTSFMGLTNIIRNQLLNCTNIVRNQALNMSNIFRNQFVNMTNIVRNQALNMANIVRNQFVNMANIARNQFVNVANIIRNQMVNAANIVRNQCVNMANIFRNQFVSMANVARNQMVNVSNIVRNQAISWSNVIRNQVTNARNAFTQQMLSMAAVARTQMVNVSNIIRNQATQWSSTIRSQSASMKSSFTSAFSGLSSIAASQMAKCLSVVKSYMSQIRAATAQQMTMSFSVNRTITTTNVTKTQTIATPASAAYAMRAVNDSMFALSAPTALAATSSNSSGIDIHGNTSSGSLSLEIPLYLDSREVAKATATYNKAELAKLEKRSKRKRGE